MVDAQTKGRQGVAAAYCLIGMLAGVAGVYFFRYDDYVVGVVGVLFGLLGLAVGTETIAAGFTDSPERAASLHLLLYSASLVVVLALGISSVSLIGPQG